MKSYINVYRTTQDIITCQFIENGIPKIERIRFKPFLGIKTKQIEKNNWTDIYGNPLKIKVFDSISDFNSFKKENKEILEFFGDISPEVQFIASTFREKIPLQTQGLTIHNFDIEVFCEKGFPRPELAEHPINSITIHDLNLNKYFVFSDAEYKNYRKDVEYFKCNNEIEILETYLDFIEKNPAHILTGWNIEIFDIPYLFNRIKRVLGVDKVKKLSRERIIKEHEIRNSSGQTNKIYSLVGHIIWDYINLYKKFMLEPRESYSLSYISRYELGSDKIDYSEEGSLSNLYQVDPQKFIDYNINDCTLVAELDRKLRFIELALSIMYKAKCCPEAIFGTVQPWDCILYNELLKRKILCPPSKNHEKREYEGGFVKDPEKGLYEWIMVYDIVSSYPNQIRSFNLSPETIIPDSYLPSELLEIRSRFGTIEKCIEVESLEEIVPILEKYNVCFTSNGFFFRKDKEGIIPKIYGEIFNERIQLKKKLKEKRGTSEEKALDLAQHALKILLNSGYGALANQFSRYFDIRIAEAITNNGQVCIRGVSNYITKKIPLIKNIYTDTDSIFLCLEKIIEKRFKKIPDKETVLNFILKFSNEIIEPLIKDFFKKLEKNMNMIQLTIDMEPECISDISIHVAKKRYIMNKIWDEGKVLIDNPKLKIRGVEIVRTSTPSYVREKIKEAVDLIFKTKSNDELIKYIENVKKEFFSLDEEKIAFPRSVTFSNYTLESKGLPIAVRAAFIFNRFIKKEGLEEKYPLIHDGEKIKFIFLKVPNILNSDVVGFHKRIPEEIKNQIEIDYAQQFEKSFLAPIKNILEVINWKIEKRQTLEDFFN